MSLYPEDTQTFYLLSKLGIIMKNFVKVCLSVVFLFLGMSYPGAIFGRESNTAKVTESKQQPVPNRDVVAIVNGQEITRQELSDLLIDTYGEDALEVLIRRALVYQEAEKEGVSATRDEIEQKLNKLVSEEVEALMRANKIQDKAELEKELLKVGINYEQFEEKIAKKLSRQAEVELLAEKVMKKTITITDEELRRAYDQIYGERIEASQIVYRTRREAEEALKKLRIGADFETMARNESIDRASAARGGKMQAFNPKDSLGKEVAHLKPGEFSDIIRTDYGYHIIKVTKRQAASNKSLDSVRGELENIIKNRHYRERLGPWLISLTENAFVRKNLNQD
ncbi:MAG: hypothetical protein E3K32_10125 [wastewater metagenome]|nr:hypothetical protein [Candidatus Loosdrechtia aerotolerans]